MKRTMMTGVAGILAVALLAGCGLLKLPFEVNLGTLLGIVGAIDREIDGGVATVSQGGLETLGRGGITLASLDVGAGSVGYGATMASIAPSTEGDVGLSSIEVSVWFAPSTAAHAADPSVIAVGDYLAFVGSIGVTYDGDHGYTIDAQRVTHTFFDNAVVSAAFEAAALTVHVEFACLDAAGELLASLSGTMSFAEVTFNLLGSLF